jgi:hypothetical protein
MKATIIKNFMPRLLDIISDIDVRFHADVCAYIHRPHVQRYLKADSFPQLASSHEGVRTCTLHFSCTHSLSTELKSPALELVKCLCHVLSLDVSLAGEITRMRRALLCQLRVQKLMWLCFASPLMRFGIIPAGARIQRRKCFQGPLYVLHHARYHMQLLQHLQVTLTRKHRIIIYIS